MGSTAVGLAVSTMKWLVTDAACLAQQGGIRHQVVHRLLTNRFADL
jgi:hypothetical protein